MAVGTQGVRPLPDLIIARENGISYHCAYQWWPNPSCDGRVVTSAVRHFKICRQKKADLMVRHVPRSRAQETALHSTRCAARLGIHPQPHPTPRRAAVASGERALVLLSVGVLPCVFG